MREILFRGKRKDNGEWIYGSHFSLHHNDHRTHIHHFIIPNNTPIPKDKPIGEIQVEVIPETVGQYTGLQDKTGKKIFEGDIVECVSWNIFFSDSSGKTPEALQRKMKVVFYNGAFKMKETMPRGLSPSHWDLIYDGDIKVIGNTHDNPELLEVN